MNQISIINKNLLRNSKVFTSEKNSPGHHCMVLFTISLFMTLCCLLSMTSCTEDLSLMPEQKEEGTFLTLRIPNIETFDSRADEISYPSTAEKTSREGTMNTLKLFAYPQGEEGRQRIIDLSHASYTLQGNYRVYSISFVPGEYKFYLFANLDRYLSENNNGFISNNLSEEGLNAIQLNFSGENQKLVDNYLPMGAFPTPQDISGSPASHLKDSEDKKVRTFTIEKNVSNQLDINMSFLCSKVRHTILFDNSSEGISKAFHNNIIEFILPENPVAVENVSQNTDLKPLESESSINGRGALLWYIALSDNNKYKYPDHLGYPLDNKDILFSWDENEKNWNTAGTKAWQYVTYLPENLSTQESDKTRLSHPYTISGEKGQTEAKTYTFKELRRAQMYDLVTEVKNSDFSEDDTKLRIEDWNLKTLQYELHGPYELIVERTDVEIVSTIRWTTMGFQTDVPVNEIGFEFPKIKIKGEYKDFYYAEVIKEGMTDEEGRDYVFDDGWQYHLRIRINPEIPYEVIKKIKGTEGKNNGTYTDEDGETFTQSSLSYFHIKAANLHKRIDITLLELEISLTVEPLTIVIDTRTYFMNAEDGKDIEISFSTNYMEDDIAQRFTLTDSKDLFSGKGPNEVDEESDATLQYYVLQLYEKNEGNSSFLSSKSSSEYSISQPSGKLILKVRDILLGNSFWNEDNEYTLTFTLALEDNKKLEKTVKIIIKPFSSNYVIHFKDATGTWKSQPHIFVYQDLLLPSDLPKHDFTTKAGREENEKDPSTHPYAGKIIGYIENNDGLNYNAATQYVFSNNISFRGWKGYGGPAINDPWQEAFCEGGDEHVGNSTMGFVMFGTKQSDGAWNDDYGYTNRVDRKYGNRRYERYRFDVNFNEDHERRMKGDWKCGDCWSRWHSGSKYAGVGNEHDYPGIEMENESAVEGEGWYRYTLTGVAQPGKTMIIFANSESPWSINGDQDNNRYPAAYETGLTLFDFEDNEGWFVFRGKNDKNGAKPTDHHFTDDKPLR